MERKVAGEEGRRASYRVMAAERDGHTSKLKYATAVTRAYGFRVDGLPRDGRARGKVEGIRGRDRDPTGPRPTNSGSV